MDQSAPLVSVVMANFNGAANIADAVRSVLRQTEASLELILSDDGSSDDSVARAREAARGDARLMVIEHPRSTGPAAARNRALAVARGKWIAIVDSDDFIHPERLQALIAAADADGADIVADDLLVFYQDHAKPAHAHLRGAITKAPTWILPSAYIRTNHLFGSVPSLGYLKPLFRRECREAALYDEKLRIAEDFDLIMRRLIAGARMRVYPALTYFYRKHAGSISHRLSLADIDAMLAAHDRLGSGREISQILQNALDRRRASLVAARDFTRLVDALKAKHIGAALGLALRNPSAAALLRYPLLDPLFRQPARARQAESGPPHIALLSRQRVVGVTNGSSSYLLSLVKAAKAAGFAVDYIGASPKIFGRWPLLKLKPELDVFSNYRVRGGIRLGPFIIATDPRIALVAALGAFERVLTKLKLTTLGWSRPAAFSIAARAERADMLFVARQVSPHTRAVLSDYAFLAPLAPYVLEPSAPNFIVMHDLMSVRVANDPSERVPDEVAALTSEKEFHLLSLADVVLAIQAGEAEQVRTALPKVKTIVAPHAVASVDIPQPGEDDTLLFVGSNTAPNVVGLRWFFDQCWPLVRAARPQARLAVAGSVARSLGVAPDGVSFLGVVPELQSHYARAGVVISPLRTGSGLKIKLIEALAAGKAMIGTSVTVQGVGREVDGALIVTDDPQTFAAEIIRLLNDKTARTALGNAALTSAKTHFSEDACFGEFISALRAMTMSRAVEDKFSSAPHSLVARGQPQQENV